MPAFFSKVFKAKDGAPSPSAKARTNAANDADVNAARAYRGDAWSRSEVEPDEVQHLIRACTHEVKSRALAIPFLLLPFRPASDPGAAKTLVRNYWASILGRGFDDRQRWLQRELRLTEPLAVCSVLKWCWSRLPGGVVTWEAYDLFRVGEHDANFARDSFATFIPLSLESDARTKIIFDFFDLLAAIAAHGKTNGLGGRKLSRLAGWWALAPPMNVGQGFDDGYRAWAKAADATSHLFFAYLRSLSPTLTPGRDEILALPRSLQALLQATEYPPETPTLMQHASAKVIMTVNAVSPTPFALLRRAKHFDYHDDDRALQAFASFDDPIRALTEECRRVLRCISSINRSPTDENGDGTGLRDPEWSHFEDNGFATSLMDDPSTTTPAGHHRSHPRPSAIGLSSTSRSRTEDHGRPTTPSWADFLSVGFADGSADRRGPSPLFLSPDQVLPPIGPSRTQSSPAAVVAATATVDRDAGADLDPGELASITVIDLDASFWWVWMTSLAGEEPPARKAVFGRCAVIETDIAGGRWLVVEEKVRGAAPLPIEGARIVKKKSRFGLTRRGRGISWRGKSGTKSRPPPPPPPPLPTPATPDGTGRPTLAGPTASVGPDSHARIAAAAAMLQQRQRQQPPRGQPTSTARRVRTEDGRSDHHHHNNKTDSVFTLQPVIMREAVPAMKWADRFDQENLREAFRSQPPSSSELASPPKGGDVNVNGTTTTTTTSSSSVDGRPPMMPDRELSKERDLPALPRDPSSDQAPLPPLPPPPPDQKVLASDLKAWSSESPASEKTSAMNGTVPYPTSRTNLHLAADYFPPSASEPIPPSVRSREQLRSGERSTAAHPFSAQSIPGSEARHGQSVEPSTATSVEPTSPSMSVEPTSPSTSDPLTVESIRAESQVPRRAGGAGALKKFFGRKNTGTQRESIGLGPFHPTQTMTDEPRKERQSLGRRLSTLQRTSSPKTVKSRGGGVAEIKATDPVGVTAMGSTGSLHAPKPPAAVDVKETLMRPDTPESTAPRRMVVTNPDGQVTPEQTSTLFSMSSHHALPEEDPRAMVSDQGRTRSVSPVDTAEAMHEVGADDAISEPSVEDPHPIVAPIPMKSVEATATFSTVVPAAPAAPTPVTVTTAASSSPPLAATPPPDRWAQIRKNAAERAAARANNEPSPSTVTTKSIISPVTPAPTTTRPKVSETSAEETIESRVARIKARVAQLTGNMEEDYLQRPTTRLDSSNPVSSSTTTD